jgi:hypothetical protein
MLFVIVSRRLFGSEQHGTGSDKVVAAGQPPSGGPVRSTGKNTSSSRVTSALWAFVLYGKNATVLSFFHPNDRVLNPYSTAESNNEFKDAPAAKREILSTIKV